MPKYKIDIWFDQKPEKIHLGSVTVEGENEEHAYKIACQKTEHWMLGEVKETSKIRG